MLLNRHTSLLRQFVGKEKVLQHGLWDMTIFLGSTEEVPVVLMVFYPLPWFLGWVHSKQYPFFGVIVPENNPRGFIVW